MKVPKPAKASTKAHLNPVRRDAGFRCLACGREVPKGGARDRDHCPFCLVGQHVDDVPGDRAARCGGLLRPKSFALEGRAGGVITFVCDRCGSERRNKALPDDVLPPAWGGPGEPVPTLDLPYGDARTLVLRTLDAIRRVPLWEPGMRVVVAVSGGLDSTVLLEVLAQTVRAHGAVLEVASIDHGLRPESVAEVARVGRRAQALGLPFHALSVDVALGANLYERARDARRAALASLGADRVATAHHQDDQAETVLLRLLRGSGGHGLRGMRAMDGLWVRPLLHEPRAVLEAWARTENVRWIDDPSNAQSLRGQVRALWPALDALHGDARSALARSARLLAYDDDALEAWIDGAHVEGAESESGFGGGIDLAAWMEEPAAVRLRMLLRLVSDRHAIRAEVLERALSWRPIEGARLELALGWSIVVRSGRLVAEAPAVVEPG